MIATLDGTNNKNLIPPINRTLSERNDAEYPPFLEGIKYRIKALQILLFDKTKFDVKVHSIELDGKLIEFNDPHKIDMYLSRNYLYMKNPKLGILVNVPIQAYRKNPRKEMNNLMRQYADYYYDLYLDYVINADNDPLSKDALELANRIQGELKGGRIESSGHREIDEKEGIST